MARIEADGGTAVALPLDVGKTDTFPAFRDSVVAALHDTWRRDTFHFLVNNAGFAQMAMFEDTTEELFDRLMSVLLKGPYFLTQILLPLLADGGAIVNTSSNAALSSGLEPGYSAYASMKGGLTVLTRYMAKEFSKRGIRVNAVAPGSTRTRLADNAFERFPEVIPGLAAKPRSAGSVNPTMSAWSSRHCSPTRAAGSPHNRSRSPADTTSSQPMLGHPHDTRPAHRWRSARTVGLDRTRSSTVACGPFCASVVVCAASRRPPSGREPGPAAGWLPGGRQASTSSAGVGDSASSRSGADCRHASRTSSLSSSRSIFSRYTTTQPNPPAVNCTSNTSGRSATRARCSESVCFRPTVLVRGHR